jgi:hypothetical protein
VRRIWRRAARQERQAPLDQRRPQLQAVVQHHVFSKGDHEAQREARLEALDGDLDVHAGRVYIGGQAQCGDASLIYGLEPHGLPDPRRARVEDPLRLLLPVLLAPWDGGVPRGVLGPHDDHVLSFPQRVRDVGAKRRVAAFVRSHLRAVDPHRGAVIHGAEVQQQSLVLRAWWRRGEGSGVPDHVVERGIPDAGEPGLVAERYGDAQVERRAAEAQVLCRDAGPTLGEPRVLVVEGERPLAVEVDPLGPAKLGARIFGAR